MSATYLSFKIVLQTLWNDLRGFNIIRYIISIIPSFQRIFYVLEYSLTSFSILEETYRKKILNKIID